MLAGYNISVTRNVCFDDTITAAGLSDGVTDQVDDIQVGGANVCPCGVVPPSIESADVTPSMYHFTYLHTAPLRRGVRWELMMLLVTIHIQAECENASTPVTAVLRLYSGPWALLALECNAC